MDSCFLLLPLYTMQGVYVTGIYMICIREASRTYMIYIYIYIFFFYYIDVITLDEFEAPN